MKFNCMEEATRFQEAMKEIDQILDFEFGSRRDSDAHEALLLRQQELLHDRGIHWLPQPKNKPNQG